MFIHSLDERTILISLNAAVRIQFQCNISEYIYTFRFRLFDDLLVILVYSTENIFFSFMLVNFLNVNLGLIYFYFFFFPFKIISEHN